MDFVIDDLMAKTGSAVPVTIYNALCYDHSDLVAAAVAGYARAGLMREIERRLKRYMREAESADHQPLLPGIPEDLQRRMGQVITVEIEDGTVVYHHLYHANTTIGHVRRHLAILRRQRGDIDKKIEAFIEAIQRCGPAMDDTPFSDALAERADA